VLQKRGSVLVSSQKRFQFCSQIRRQIIQEFLKLLRRRFKGAPEKIAEIGPIKARHAFLEYSGNV
jgi:hypothetical protein